MLNTILSWHRNSWSWINYSPDVSSFPPLWNLTVEKSRFTFFSLSTSPSLAFCKTMSTEYHIWTSIKNPHWFLQRILAPHLDVNSRYNREFLRYINKLWVDRAEQLCTLRLVCGLRGSLIEVAGTWLISCKSKDPWLLSRISPSREFKLCDNIRSRRLSCCNHKLTQQEVSWYTLF